MFLENCDLFETHDEEDLFNLLVPVFANDEKGHGKQNVIDSLKILFATTPLGLEQIVAQIDFTAKTTTRGDTISLNSITQHGLGILPSLKSSSIPSTNSQRLAEITTSSRSPT